MGLYVYKIVIDTNVINSRNDIIAMTKLEDLFKIGIIELLKTDTLLVELEKEIDISRKEKVKKYRTIYGENVVDHTTMKSIYFGRKSNFEIIYHTLWGEYWKMGGAYQDKIHDNSTRDALHLNVCWINEVDYFITNENKIIEKRGELYAKGFDCKIVNPEECVELLENDYLQDFKTKDPIIIRERLKETHKILLGSNQCQFVDIKDPKTNEVIFKTHLICDKFCVEANIFDENGNLLARLYPNKDPEIIYRGVSLSYCGSENQFTLSKDGEIFLSSRIVPSGHIIFEGKFFNSEGKLIAEAHKKEFNYLSFMKNTQNIILPPVSD
ncbi:MAG: hypothetical protein WCX88_03480 [Patescibacteria group bacterium]